MRPESHRTPVAEPMAGVEEPRQPDPAVPHGVVRSPADRIGALAMLAAGLAFLSRPT